MPRNGVGHAYGHHNILAEHFGNEILQICVMEQKYVECHEVMNTLPIFLEKFLYQGAWASEMSISRIRPSVKVCLHAS